MDERPDNEEKPRESWLKRLIVPAVLVVVFLVAVVTGLLPNIGFLRYYIDGYTINRPAYDAPQRMLMWEAPAALSGDINEIKGNFDATVSIDEKLAIISHQFAKNDHNLYVSRLGADGMWSRPLPLRALNTPYDEMGPELSSDGKTLYFHSNRPGGAGAYDIWFSTKIEDEWSAPVNAGAAINTRFNEIDPAVSPDNDRFFIASDRPVGLDGKTDDGKKWPTVHLLEPHERDFNVYGSSLIPPVPQGDETAASPPVFGTPEYIDILNTTHDEGKVAVTRRGDKIYFVSNRPGGEGRFDLYRSYLYGSVSTKGDNLGTPINTIYDETSPSITLDGFGLYFCSNRRSRHRGEFTVFSTVSREVIVRYDYSLLIACLIILATIAAIYYILRALMSNVDMKTVTKCLLLSLLLHLLLIALSSSWYVTARLGESVLKGPKEMTVNINNLARENISMAIREGVAALPKISASSPASRPAASVSVPSQQPMSQAVTATESTKVASVAKSSASPISMAPSETMTGSSPPAADSSITAVAPMRLGASGISMEMPKKQGRGDGQGDQDSTDKQGGGRKVPKREDEEIPVKKVEFKLAKLRPAPMKIHPSQLKDNVKNVVNKHATGEGTVDSIIRSYERHDSSAGDAVSEPMSGKVSVAAVTGGVRSSSKSVGMLMFPANFKMEVSKAARSDEVAATLGLLERDPFHSEELPLTIEKGECVRVPEKLIEDYKLVDTMMRFQFFLPIEFLRRLGLLKPVGGLIYSQTPKLDIPADSELEVPEKYVKEELNE